MWVWVSLCPLCLCAKTTLAICRYLEIHDSHVACTNELRVTHKQFLCSTQNITRTHTGSTVSGKVILEHGQWFISLSNSEVRSTIFSLRKPCNMQYMKPTLFGDFWLTDCSVLCRVSRTCALWFWKSIRQVYASGDCTWLFSWIIGWSSGCVILY